MGIRVIALLLPLLLGALLAPAAFGQGSLSSPASSPRPNFVFIIADDLRYDYLGCTGHPAARTPHIDRIAAEGMLFRNFFVATPLCSPSRASFLTGVYPHKHRIINNDKLGNTEISHTLYTWPRALREAGYETAFIGKWHMGLDDSRRPGFDHWISFKGQGLYIDPVVNVNGEQRQLTGYATDFLNRSAVEFLQKPRDKPFVLYLSHKAVHIPYIPAERHETLYGDVKYAPPSSAADDLRGKPVMTRKVDKVDAIDLEGVTPEPAEPRRGRGRDPDDIVRDQLRCIASVDEGVGQVFAALAQGGKLDTTVLIFTGDNGYLMGEHGLMDNKRWAYEESIRVPFLVRYPPLIAAGSVSDSMVVNVDVAPTMLELAGVRPIVEMHGRSFASLLKDPRKVMRDAVLLEYFLEKVGPRVPSWQAVRTSGWKYIRYPALEGMDELYNLSDDPYEMRNVIADPAAAATLKQMQARLEAQLKETR